MLDTVEAFLEDIDAKPNTVAAYRNDVTQFLTFLKEEYEDTPIHWSALQQRHVEAFLYYLMEREYAASSVARKIAAVKRFCQYLVSQGILHENPANDVETPRVKKSSPQTLTVEQVERLLSQPARKTSAKGRRDAAMLETLYATGLRVSELVSLRLTDVDLSSGTLRTSGPDGSERRIPLTERAKGALRTYIEHGRVQLVNDPSERHLYLNMRGGPLTRQGLWLIIREYVEQAGIDANVSPHTLRHTFAAHQLQDGANVEEVQKVLGHASRSTTQAYQQDNG